MTSPAWYIKNGSLVLDENFVYDPQELPCTAVITAIKPKDNYGNTPFSVKITIDNKVIKNIAMINVSIFPKGEKKINGKGGEGNVQPPTLAVASNKFQGSFLELFHAIFTAVSDASIKAKTSFRTIKPFYSPFDFESPQFIARADEYEISKGKKMEKWDKSMDIQIFFDKKTNILSSAIGYVPEIGVKLPKREYLTNEQAPLTKTKLDLYRANKESLVRGGFDLPKIVYGKTLMELNKLSEDELAEYNELIEKESYEKMLKGKIADFIMIKIDVDLRCTGRQFSSWKPILGSLVVAPRKCSAEESYETGNEFYDDIRRIKNDMEEARNNIQETDNDEFVD